MLLARAFLAARLDMRAVDALIGAGEELVDVFAEEAIARFDQLRERVVSGRELAVGFP